MELMSSSALWLLSCHVAQQFEAVTGLSRSELEKLTFFNLLAPEELQVRTRHTSPSRNVRSAQAASDDHDLGATR